MLARRDYPRAALEQRLAGRGADPAEVTRTLDELERLGYLSDARFAHMLVAQKSARFGKRAIAHAMRAQRVEATAARAALDTLAGSDELALARAVWARRFRSAPGDERERARQIRFLIARGYGVAVALAVVGRSCADACTDHEAGTDIGDG
ncbi:MAG TPA: regulatory protein RecX [Casimicrobiaceae bacterium]|nr:regulatory protein RecX [Casimicrobiaceae bacterium]